MPVNTAQSQRPYALSTAASVNIPQRQIEHALESTQTIVEMLRQKKGVSIDGETRPPGDSLKNDLAFSGRTHSTVEENNSHLVEDTSVEENNSHLVENAAPSPKDQENNSEKSPLAKTLEILGVENVDNILIAGDPPK